MTRINVVEVKELCNKHLMAEYREMPRLVKNLNTSLNRKGKPFCKSEISPEYILGPGHVKFFFDKFEYLHKRHIKITEELLDRGYNLSNTDSSIFATVDKKWYNDYIPTNKAIKLNKQRIKQRMPKFPKWRVSKK
jgi:deoxyribonuclease (pyrimidine dimer)